jgi:hypothetical protein
VPRGERSGEPGVQAKRRATFEQRRLLQSQRAAQRLLRRWTTSPANARFCVDWLAARHIRLDDPDLTPAQRLRWLRRALRADEVVARKNVGTTSRGGDRA